MKELTGTAYPINLEYWSPKDGRPWMYEAPAEMYWVWVLDGWVGRPKLQPEFQHFAPMRTKLDFFLGMSATGTPQGLQGPTVSDGSSSTESNWSPESPLGIQLLGFGQDSGVVNVTEDMGSVGEGVGSGMNLKSVGQGDSKRWIHSALKRCEIAREAWRH